MTFKSVETPEQLPLLAISLTDRCGSQHSYLLGTELAGANKIDEGFQFGDATPWLSESRWSRFHAALMSAICDKAWGKFPRCSPHGPSCSA